MHGETVKSDGLYNDPLLSVKKTETLRRISLSFQNPSKASLFSRVLNGSTTISCTSLTGFRLNKHRT
jgi:hypothetical protein